ncbi:MAG: ABC transporter permease, partial [bacterium]
LQNPVGEMVKISGDHDFHVIGVVENFSFFPLERDDKPLAFLYVYAVPIYRYLSLKLRSEDMAGTIARVKSVWDGVYADVPFEYQFVDQVVQLQYGKIEKMQTVSGYATVLAILVACLGLFGLVVFAAEQRTKEIGIRKVLGATMANVTALLSKDFIKLVLLANLLAWPVAWFAMNKWLQNFAYRIEISWWVFVLAGGLALVIALLTVSTQAIRAALANPVESLRYE